MKKGMALGLIILFLLGTGLAVAVAQPWPTPHHMKSAQISYTREEWDANWSLPPADLENLHRAQKEDRGTPSPAWPEHYINYQLELVYPDSTRTLYISWDGQVYCPSENKMYPELSTLLLPHIDAMDSSFFGTPLPWSTVNPLWPRKTKALVTDVDTARSFWMFRWGGNLHADVEPMTAHDAQVMEEIYGEYTWRRRAVIVEVQGHRIAGSLHSMPHGGGNISGNHFNGHCCLHFAGSMTHGTRRQDPAHAIMVSKAAGLWWQHLAERDPVTWAHHYLTIWAQRDFSTLNLHTLPEQRSRTQQLALELTSIRISQMTAVRVSDATAEIAADLTLYFVGDWDPHEIKVTLFLERHEVSQSWQLMDLTGW